jgi:SRSO17 transposase
MSSVAGMTRDAAIDRLLARMTARFPRVTTRRRAGMFLRGLLAELPTRNCWAIAEHVGDRDPHAMQNFLARAVWDTDGVRDDLRDYVIEHLGDADAVLVFDETGDLKKGTATVGVQRQYTGTAGRIENAQVAVYLAYAGRDRHALIDHELYLPRSWIDDPDRCREAGVPADVEFATKPALAAGMLTRAVQAQVPARWVAGDEVYGDAPDLARECEYHRIGYVLAISRDRQVVTAAGRERADLLAARLPRWAWQRLSAGHGAKGERVYDWAWITLHPDANSDSDGDTADTRCWWLLVRRNPATGELAYYRCYSPQPVPLRELVRVAGRRWSIEESFQAGKGLAGLDEHQVRGWTSWYRWTLLAMTAHALLAVLARHAAQHDEQPDGMIALTCNEIRRLVTRLADATDDETPHILTWSHWRRRHQQRARTSHYQRREALWATR